MLGRSRPVGLMLLGLLAVVAPSSAQATRDSVGPVPYDTTITVPRDSLGPTTHDTIYVVLRDSTVRLCCHDSTFKVPIPVASVPSGFRLLSVRPFDAATELNWVNRTTGLQLQIVSDSAHGNIGRAIFPAGLRAGTGPISSSLLFPGSPSLYVAFDLRLSPNFQGSCTSRVNKVFHLWHNGNTVAIPAVYGCGTTGPLTFQVRFQNLVGGAAKNFSGGSIVRGRWYHIAILFVGSTVTWSIDGIPVGTGTIALQPGSWSQVQWNPTWGGDPAIDKVTVPFSMDMDNVLVATGP